MEGRARDWTDWSEMAEWTWMIGTVNSPFGPVIVGLGSGMTVAAVMYTVFDSGVASIELGFGMDQVFTLVRLTRTIELCDKNCCKCHSGQEPSC